MYAVDHNGCWDTSLYLVVNITLCRRQNLACFSLSLLCAYVSAPLCHPSKFVSLFLCPPRPLPNHVRGKTRFPSTVLQSVYRGLWIKLTEDGLTGDRQVSLLMLMFLCARGCHRKKWKPKDAITRGSGVWFIYHLNGRWWISGSAGKKQTNPRHKRRGFGQWVRKIPLEKDMASHSSILAWRIPWTEEPGGLWCTRLQRVRYDWVPRQACRTEQRKRYLGSLPGLVNCRLPPRAGEL